jgi:hypothetical protein
MNAMSLDGARNEAGADFAELDALIERDRRRKLLAVVPVAGVVGAAVALQATWLLAVVATGVIGVQALRRDR